MERDVNRISHIEGNIDRLPPKIRAGIESAERKLTASLPRKAQAAFAAFRVDGVEHKAYYVPHVDADGTKRYVFRVLIY
jgi:hypothetical protein